MASLFLITCDSCNYQVDDIIDGDPEQPIAVCTHCRQIRNPQLPTF